MNLHILTQTALEGLVSDISSIHASISPIQRVLAALFNAGMVPEGQVHSYCSELWVVSSAHVFPDLNTVVVRPSAALCTAPIIDYRNVVGSTVIFQPEYGTVPRWWPPSFGFLEAILQPPLCWKQASTFDVAPARGIPGYAQNSDPRP
ncbi:hypothetical protein CONLIGDRAFT_683504 [Coniochaeta ligniaria NRRL 30616]|uniref:Uncharacterized protein n=1 Tax=Coniochaeta ligniaria NRRL 30616 TaxID=1408157 RepID=A0A1J7JFZ8_9PEZI|nr:hypothetical protein CONLIGDRAFT_683504 [Coniochaeta ligniaria NRRL 30616]